MWSGYLRDFVNLPVISHISLTVEGDAELPWDGFDPTRQPALSDASLQIGDYPLVPAHGSEVDPLI